MAEVTKTYYVWLVAQSDDYAEALVAKLVRRGFTIGPLGRALITKHDDNPAAVVAMSIFRIPRNDDERKEWTATGVHEEVCSVMKHIKGKFWGAVVSGASDCTWNVGNMSIHKEEKTQAEALKKVN